VKYTDFNYTIKRHLIGIKQSLISKIHLKIHFNYLPNTATYNFSQNFRTMKLIKYFFFLPASAVLLFLACNPTTTNLLQSGNWVSLTVSPGNTRFQAVSFVVGDTAYVGTGYDGNVRYNDFFSFSVKDGWSNAQQIASLPSGPNASDSAPARNGAVAFAIGRNGYITTGTDGYTKYNDTWAYNVDNGTWTRAADFPSTPRYGASAFALLGKGYVTCGYDNQYKKDNWQFSPTGTTNGLPGTWIQMAQIGETSTAHSDLNAIYSAAGNPRLNAITFVHGDSAYIVGGLGQSGANVNDFYKFLPPSVSGISQGKWVGLRVISNASTENYDDDYSDIVRNSGVGFVMGDSAYITVGINGGYTQKTWAYDFKTDLWSRKSNFERSGREGAVAFVINGKGYVSSGKASGTYFFDLEEFQPYIALNTND